MFVPFVVLVAVAVVASLLFAGFNFVKVKKLSAGNAEMQEVAGAIKEGAEAFISHEYKVIAIAAAVVAVVLGVLLDVWSGISFVMGVLMSGLAGFIGMKIATIANVRVSNTARETGKLGSTLKVAFKGGSVMGLCVGGFALLGLLLCYLIFGKGVGLVNVENLVVKPNGFVRLEYIPFTMVISSYALGCSMVALFNRIGGGIYTKAADMGADLVGKAEEHIPEDDARNPATIADNVGDNVGDVAGLGSDLLESYVGSIIAAIVLAAYTYFTSLNSQGALTPALLDRLMLFPMALAGLGILACIIGIAYVLLKKPSEHPHRELNMALWSSAALIVGGGALLSWGFFRDVNLPATLGFKAGFMSPWIGAIIGIVSGILIGLLAEYYTSADYKPTKNLMKVSPEGTALTITKGLALGMRSCFLPVLVLGAAVVGAASVAGIYGVTMAAVGMLSFVAATVSVDTYGPIADNAGGISEMSKLDPEVRKITDKLDSVGNTTAAIGKGFAIGSGALAALSLLISFIHSQVGSDGTGAKVILDMIKPLTIAGAFIGGALPFFFSGLLTDAVAKSAQYMVKEVRRQFREQPGILTGEVRPDYKQCIKISAAGALKEMKFPVLIALAVPLAGGFIFGADFVGGILIGATITAIMLAIFTANAGGAWDNAKKGIEQGALEGIGKGSPAHDAAIVGDTVGDPLKDTVGPSLDILIKIMATVSLIGVSIFGNYNLASLIGL
ncbi:MAG: sodium-translocating pyrophosphatase [Clostridiaceae bacterium]|jgi:K(+)-stimulated pyrophosphate-energized sodium pump|nr:sodium-translocating pyrophosphatase [Clostridiaceae bacterium]